MCETYIDWLPLMNPQLGVWPATQACALTGDQIGDLLVCRQMLSPLSHTSTEPHQPGLNSTFKKLGSIKIKVKGGPASVA